MNVAEELQSTEHLKNKTEVAISQKDKPQNVISCMCDGDIMSMCSDDLRNLPLALHG